VGEGDGMAHGEEATPMSSGVMDLVRDDVCFYAAWAIVSVACL
jgi:hypothetical protein